METPRSLRKVFFPYLLIAPAILVLFVFVIYPIGYMVYLSFYNWNMMSEKTFVGFENYLQMFSDSDFYQTLGNTFYYTAFALVFGMGIAIGIALFLKKNTRLNQFIQRVVFLPYIMPMVTVAFIWVWLMDSDYGLLNFILEVLHLPTFRWLQDTKTAMVSIIIVTVWKSAGYNTLIILSAMQAVPSYLYEAADLDKAGAWRKFSKITFPMISPTLFFLTLMNLIACFKVFESVNIMTSGGPVKSTTTLVYSIYQYGFSFYKIGYASAEGVVLMVIIGICTIAYFGALSKKVHYQ